MMALTATGIFSQPDRLEYLVASSSTWQEVCGTTSEATAKNFVHTVVDGSHADDYTMSVYPRAIANWLESDSFSRTRIARTVWGVSGTMTLAFEIEVPPEYSDLVDAQTWFMNKIGDIISEMEQNSGLGEPVSGETHLNVTAITRLDGPFPQPNTEIDVQDPDMYEQRHIEWIVFTVEYMG